MPLFVIVGLNYLVQIPYNLHLYHGKFNFLGVILLIITLVWFISSIWLLKSKHRLGFWLLLAFLSVEFIFYFGNEVVLLFFGYGLIYHLLHTKDFIVWTAFLVGDINFFISGYYIYYLLTKRDLFVFSSKRSKGR